MFFTIKFECPNCSNQIDKNIIDCPFCKSNLFWKEILADGEVYIKVIIDKTSRQK